MENVNVNIENNDTESTQKTLESSEAILNSINDNMSKMLKILDSEYDLQKKAEDRLSREKATGKAIAKKTEKKSTSQSLNEAIKFNPAGNLMDFLKKNGGILGMGLSKLGPLMMKVGRLPFTILKSALKMGGKLAIGSGAMVVKVVPKLVTKLTNLVLGGASKLFGVDLKAIIKAGISTAKTKVMSVLSKIMAKIPQSLLGFVSKMIGGLKSTIGPLIKNGASKILPRLVSSLNIAADIAMMLSWVWKYIRKYLFEWTKNSPILNKIVHMMDDIIMPISNFFDHMTDVIMGIFQGDFSKVTDAIWAMLGDVWDLFKGIFSPVLEATKWIGEKIADGAKWIYEKFSNVISNAWGFITKAFDNVTKYLSTILDPLIGYFTNLFGFFKSVFNGNLTDAKKFLTDAIDKVFELVKNIFKPITDAFGAIGDKLKNIGKAVWAAIKNPKNPIEAFTKALDGQEVVATTSPVSNTVGNAVKIATNGIGNLGAKVSGYASGAIASLSGERAKREDAALKYFSSKGYDKEQIAMIMGQLAHETGNFKYKEELIGEAKANQDYGTGKKAKDLGNINVSDGYRYRGRGLIQLTGRANYLAAGKALGIDLVNNPDLASTPEYESAIADWYLRRRSQKAINDKDIVALTKSINGGTRNMEDRIAYTKKYATTLQDQNLQVAKIIPTKPKVAKIIPTKPTIQPVQAPRTAIATQNIKLKPEDKTLEKTQVALLSNIQSNTTPSNQFGLDSLPHSENLLKANQGMGV